MRAPLLSFIVVVAIVSAVPLVQAQYEKLDGKGEEAAAAAGYGPPKKATEKPMEQTVDARATPAMTPNAYNDKATASGTEVKKEKSDVSADSALPRKVKKVEKAKKEKAVESGKKENKEPVYLDGYYLDKGTSSKNEKKEKSGEHASGKKEKEKSINSGGSSAYVKKEEKKSGADEAVSPKKEKKEKIEDEKSLKKEKKEEEKSGDYSVKKENKEKSVKDATPVAASTDDAYVPK